MIPRYSKPEMSFIWSEERKFAVWLEIELLACEGMAELGLIPVEDVVVLRQKARINPERIREIEGRTHHDVIAFLEAVAESVGPEARWMHQGMTSSDVLDTALAVQMREAGLLLQQRLEALRAAIARRALEHKFTPMMGRSHGIHAEPITFGLKLALMYDEFGRALERLHQISERVSVGKLSGAVGTHAHLDPRVEEYVCRRLGLKPATVSTQILQRDLHAEFLCTLALIAASVERWATEFRHLQRTEVLEVEEFFAEGQKGSSAMPHKRNPITGERLCGLARVIRGHAVTALENVALWHERDISHSSAERIILPDACILLDYMLDTLRELVAKLVVYPENMRRNLDLTGGIYASQGVLLQLTRKGMERKAAYEAVQRAALRAWQEKLPLAQTLAEEPEVAGHLSAEEMASCFSLEPHMAHIEEKFRKLGILPA